MNFRRWLHKTLSFWELAASHENLENNADILVRISMG